MTVVNLKSVIRNGILKHPVLMSFWCGERHHSASLTSYYCLMEPAAAASPPAELGALCVIGLSDQIWPSFPCWFWK